MECYMAWPVAHGMVHGMAWRAWHGIWNGIVVHGMVHGKAWRAWNAIWYCLAGIPWRGI